MATKIDEIFTADLTLTVKSMVKILSIFVAFLKNMNFNGQNLVNVVKEGLLIGHLIFEKYIPYKSIFEYVRQIFVVGLI